MIILIVGVKISKFKHHYIKCDESCYRWLNTLAIIFDAMCIVTLMLPNMVVYVIHHKDRRYLEEEFVLPMPMLYDFQSSVFHFNA